MVYSKSTPPPPLLPFPPHPPLPLSSLLKRNIFSKKVLVYFSDLGVP
jgi:hypothetical protein